MSYKRFINAVIICLGVLFVILGIGGHEPMGIVIGVVVTVFAVVSMIPKDRAKTPQPPTSEG